MKIIYTFIIITIILFFTSNCKKEDYSSSPSINFIKNVDSGYISKDTALKQDVKFKFGIYAKAIGKKNNINRLIIYVDDKICFDTILNINPLRIDYIAYKDTSKVNIWKFKVVDRSSNSDSISIKISLAQ
jgi:hypothetical protein